MTRPTYPPQKICCPVDFSQPSRAALELAVQVARLSATAEIDLIHAQHEVAPLPPDGALLPTGFYAQLEEQLTAELERWRRTVEVAGVAARATLEQGVPWRVVTDHATRNASDLIVMGTHGRTGIKHLLLGSVAERVVRMAPCPVLTVAPHEPAQPREPHWRCGELARRTVAALRSDDTLMNAARTLRDQGTPLLPVVDANTHLVGTLTRDDVLDQVARNPRAGDTLVGDVMRRDPLSCLAEDDALEAARRMESNHETHILVVERNGCLVGRIDATDLPIDALH